MKYLFDTNAVINFVCNKGYFSNFDENDKIFISFVTYIELSVGLNSKEEEQIVKLFIDKADCIMIDITIIDKTINVRKSFGLKLPDSIIVATALHEAAILVTSDKRIITKATDMNIKTFDPLVGDK